MADDGSSQGANAWPMPKFFFQVEWGSQILSFQEVSGLDMEAQVIEYRHADHQQFSTVKMPGLKKIGNVTMKKGIFKNDPAYRSWFDKLRAGTAQRGAVKISLIDESGDPTMVWTLANAWPAKISGTDLKSDGNEVAVESIEVAHEGISVVTA